MSATSILLDNLSTYLSQSSTSNLSASERLRYLNISRDAVAGSHDWPHLYKEADLTVDIASGDEQYSTAAVPSDLKGRKVKSIYYGPSLFEYIAVDEHDFWRERPTNSWTFTIPDSTEVIALNNVSGADADSDAILAAQALSSSSTTAVTTFTASPDVPRQILFTPGGTTANIGAGNIVVVGLDGLNRAKTENVAISAAQSSAVATTGHFYRITSITFPQASGSGATFDIGTNSNVGLRISYLKKLTAMTVSSDGTGFPDDMDELIVLGAAYRVFMKFNRDPKQVNSYKLEYRERLLQDWTTFSGKIKSERLRIKNVRETYYRPISTSKYAR